MRSGRTSRCSHNKEPRTWYLGTVPYSSYQLRAEDSSWTSLHVAISDRCGADVVATGITPRFDGKMIALVLVAAPSLQISRRALAAPAAAALVSQYAAACEAVVGGSACLGDASCGMDSRAGARLAATPVGEKAGIRFGGSYSDAASGCARRITLAGTSALISGTDEDGTPFKARGTVAGKTLTVDLGGAALVGTWNGLGIVFSDGNTWTKK